ncbi:putative glutaminyl-tRNA synthetase [Klebsormidium nitens]|uniref:glutamine--tRNA ligase n=1 Tax=Klebsormidium nitens TaxID=105231 RepID=A0A1Y1HZ43_KLENI|nr:putative glutaminyl-tRNA synthetase [Klebsormidium nitens]|eukprot:GAQ83924.1 putative glutaminyl-tRNA synthetase [Klebsormidium nitens]
MASPKEPGKTGPKDVDNEGIVALFLRIGIEEKTAKTTVANTKVTNNLIAVIDEAGLSAGCDRVTGNHLYTTATKFPANALGHRKHFLEYIADGRIKSIPQVEAAFEYLATVGRDELNVAEFEEKAGVGVEVTPEQIKAAVAEVLAADKERLLVERYKANTGKIQKTVREKLPFADGKLVKVELDEQLLALLGPKTAEDEKKPEKKKVKPAKAPKEEKAAEANGPTTAPVEESDPFAMFPKPADNFQVHTEIRYSDGNIWRPANSKERLARHLKETGGKVLTRFPPEPNGYLHIGHAKAMFVDFGLAHDRDGGCYLRYDDTNPEAEKQEYIDHIQEIVGWLGWKPWKITYSSDYFQELYDLAVELIKRGHAYVDHQTADEIKDFRERRAESPWRNRPTEESLRLFDEMRRGLWEEGTATLRMKQDVKNDNFNMFDLIAYRIKYTPHPHAGDKWCIYPSYDYTHCIVDSLENITHSLCTLEFETRRASYYWLLEALGLYLPHVWEYARLSIANTVLSKRKLNKLVTDHWVDGWDDPRLMTLAGLRRRGASPEAINSFCRALGITRSDNIIQMELLEHHIRDDMNRRSARTMVVLKPVRVVITNLAEGHVEQLEALVRPDIKEDQGHGTYKVPFSRVIYIEDTDVRLKDSKDYYGLAPGKTVMLRYAYPITCTEIVTGPDNETIVEVRATYDPEKSTKPKGVIHWVSEPAPGVSPLKVEVRLIDRLFKSENPNELDDWLADLNPNSKTVISDALAVPHLADARIGDKFQFERLGYFCVDTDSKPGRTIFNRTVTLRDSYPKVGGKA